jgi:hypothetical protein
MLNDFWIALHTRYSIRRKNQGVILKKGIEGRNETAKSVSFRRKNGTSNAGTKQKYSRPGAFFRAMG